VPNTKATTEPLVLVIDDDEGIRDTVVELLVDEGFAAIGACNGAEALSFLAESESRPSLILLDLMMPVLDGWAFCRIRQRVAKLKEIPVVAMSAGPMSGAREPLGVDAILPKPFDPDMLTRVATRMSARKSSAGRRVEPQRTD
jgi:CheY-like chemotaxis protein